MLLFISEKNLMVDWPNLISSVDYFFYDGRMQAGLYLINGLFVEVILEAYRGCFSHQFLFYNSLVNCLFLNLYILVNQ